MIAVYVISCPTSNALGLYYLPLPTLCHEVSISKEGALKGLRSLSEALFCEYDAASEWIWVPKMARFQIGESLEPNDNRVKWIKKELEPLRKSPFFNDFLDQYREAFHLEDISPSQAPSKSLRRDNAPVLVPDLDQSLALVPDPEGRRVDQAEALARLWNEVAPDLSPAQIPLGAEVRKDVRKKLKAEPSLEKWREIFERANRSPLLKGEKGDFHATFSWAMEKSNFAEKVLDGSWDASTKFSNGKDTVRNGANEILRQIGNGQEARK